MLAEARGKAGERYILGGANVTLREFLTEVAEVSGLRPPWLPLGRGTALLGAALLAALARLQSEYGVLFVPACKRFAR